MTAAEELQIREKLSESLNTVTSIGEVIPAPLYCNDASDFYATLDSAKDSKDEIELTPIAACWFYPIGFSDDLTSSKPDSPLVLLDYELYLFRQYGLQRADETETPDVFDSQMLKLHNQFIEAYLGIKSVFQGNRLMGLDTNVFAINQTTSIVHNQDIENKAICKFVPGIVGFAATLRETVKIKLVDC